jgi:opacity protein-like surface antigen
VTSLLALALSDVASAQKPGASPPRTSDRIERREFSLFLRQFTAPEFTKPDVTLPGLGTNTGKLQIENTTLLGVQFGYNLREQLSLNMEFAYGRPDFKGSWGNKTFSGNGDIFTGDLNVEYNVLKKPFTPFVGAGVGFMYFDSQIRKGTPETYCWWDYWWGYYYCTTTQDTRDTTEFTYNVAAGLRWDMNETLFMKASYRAMWADIGASGRTLFPQYIITFGWMW